MSTRTGWYARPGSTFLIADGVTTERASTLILVVTAIGGWEHLPRLTKPCKLHRQLANLSASVSIVDPTEIEVGHHDDLPHRHLAHLFRGRVRGGSVAVMGMKRL